MPGTSAFKVATSIRGGNCDWAQRPIGSTVATGAPQPAQAALERFAVEVALGERERAQCPLEGRHRTRTASEGVEPASLESGPRSWESLIRVLFNHNDFATIH